MLNPKLYYYLWSTQISMFAQNTRQTSANNRKTNRNTRNIGKHGANFYFFFCWLKLFYEIYYFLFCALLCPVSPTQILCGLWMHFFFVASKSLSHSIYNHQCQANDVTCFIIISFVYKVFTIPSDFLRFFFDLFLSNFSSVCNKSIYFYI